MTQYGDNQEPGIITDLTSSAAVSTSTEAPNNIGLVGQADLNNANDPADTSKVYQISQASTAVEKFGPAESSMLTNAVVDSLNEGAFPVYAVATESTSVVSEDHSSVETTTVTIDNTPIRESVDSITVDLDGADQDVNIVYDDVDSYSPGTEECYVNPVRGTLEVESVPDTNLDISYDHFDYTTAIDVMVDIVPDIIDFLVPLSENTSVVDYANVQVGNMESEYNLALMNGGAGIHVDPVSFTQNYDDSRSQVVYPTRFTDNTSAIAPYVAYKSKLGLNTTPINKRLNTNKSLSISLSRAERGSLIDNQVVPLANESRGVRIADDPTTVSESNTDEQNLTYGFSRLVADYIIQTQRVNQKPFIGKLNSVTVRNTLEGMVNDSLTELQQSNAVISYDVNVVKEDPVTAGVEMSVDIVEPLRFIKNTVTVENGG